MINPGVGCLDQQACCADILLYLFASFSVLGVCLALGMFAPVQATDQHLFLQSFMSVVA